MLFKKIADKHGVHFAKRINENIAIPKFLAMSYAKTTGN